jgi:hypothetical protein
MFAHMRGRGSGPTPRETGRHTSPPEAAAPRPTTETKAGAHAAKTACEAELEKVRCELSVERLRREDKEDAEERKRQRKEQAEERKELRRRKRKEARYGRWEAFWERRRKRREAPGSTAEPIYAAAALGIPPLLALVIYALTLSGETLEALGIGVLTAAAAFAVGALFGFLFGIPRSLAADSGAQAEKKAAQEATAVDAAITPHYTTNTNLEQISDWLTKILVGVGLVQIHQVSGAVEDLADGLAPGLGPQGFSVAVALLVAFSITGFVTAYLFTRLRLPGALELASVIKLAVKERADTETTAIALVQQQLTPGVEKPTLDELVKALKAATPGVQQQAFFLARRQRCEALGDGIEGNERTELVERTITVFEALLACEAQQAYVFRLRAELGYARLQLPDYPGAKAEFDEAIKLRPPDFVNRTPGYELNRAYCTIKLEGSYEREQPSSPTVTSSVYEDLNAVINHLDFKEVDKKKREAITKWLRVNSASTNEPAPSLAALLERLEEAARS